MTLILSQKCINERISSLYFPRLFPASIFLLRPETSTSTSAWNLNLTVNLKLADVLSNKNGNVDKCSKPKLKVYFQI